MTKGEINRLGSRLTATSTPAEADLQQLAAVLEAYQAVLERVKEDLRGLGFSPTGRVKTTPTMTDKLRRTGAMELARMQDLAGARFVVDDLEKQDEARAKISQFYWDLGCPVRVANRCTDPRFGYRAVHVIVTIEAMPVEIQIRTELQDSWAQIVERLADRWGRGIRYGEPPDEPERRIRSGVDQISTRQEAVATLMSLSETMYRLELDRKWSRAAEEEVARLALAMGKKRFRGHRFRRARRYMKQKITAEGHELRESLVQYLSSLPDDQVGEAAGEILAAGEQITGSQLMQLTRITSDHWKRTLSEARAGIQASEGQVRVILQLVADSGDEEA